MNILKKYYLILLQFIFVVLVQSSTTDDRTYTVGVVEFNRAKGNDSELKLDENLKTAKQLLRNQIANGKPGDRVDIIVFPESVLNDHNNPVIVPDPKDKKILCNNNIVKPDLLNQLSCWAGSFQKYMIFNIIEKTECTPETQKQQNDNRPCAKDGLNRYNTNVVFDKNGALIAKYRKFNPYHEYLINTTLIPDYTTFETDFNVTFGTGICFDILFKKPMQDLVTKNNITDIIYPTYWFSELPFLTANQIQQAWSYANNVNFLAAGGNTPETGTTGTGIYSGKTGYISVMMTNQRTTRMLISDVPKMAYKNDDEYLDQVNNLPEYTPKISLIPNRLIGLKMLREPNVDNYIFKSIDKEGEINEKICHNDICCEFDLNVKTLQKQEEAKFYYYKMIAFSGKRDYFNGYRIQHYKACAIIACTDDTGLKSCGHIFPDEIRLQNYYYFSKLNIKGTFKETDEVLFMPTSVDLTFKPLPAKQFVFDTKKESQSKTIQMKLKNENSDLLTFGIYAIDYKNSAIKNQYSTIFTIIFSILCIYICKKLF